MSLKKANAHFSDDLLSSLLNEPIPGQGVFWSSVGGKPYPVSLRVLSFERLYKALDPDYSGRAAHTYAVELRKLFGGSSVPAQASLVPEGDPVVEASDEQQEARAQAGDPLAAMEQEAIAALEADEKMMERINSQMGAAWGSVKAYLLDRLPEHLDDRDTIAYNLVRKAMDQIFGVQGQAWESYRNSQRDHKTYVRIRK